MVEGSVTDLDDILKTLIAKAKAALDRIRGRTASAFSFDPGAIEQFGWLMHQSISSGDVPFSKACMRAVVDRIEVDDDVIRIIVDKATLKQAIAAGETGAPRRFSRRNASARSATRRSARHPCRRSCG